MNELLNNLNETKVFLANMGFDKATVGVVLGTGLGELINHINIEKVYIVVWIYLHLGGKNIFKVTIIF